MTGALENIRTNNYEPKVVIASSSGNKLIHEHLSVLRTAYDNLAGWRKYGRLAIIEGDSTLYRLQDRDVRGYFTCTKYRDTDIVGIYAIKLFGDSTATCKLSGFEIDSNGTITFRKYTTEYSNTTWQLAFI